MTAGDWLPAQAPFDLVRRGFAPDQVTAHLERLEYDLRITTANRDATNQRLSELGAQLAAAQAEADTLRAQLDRSALEPISMGNLSDRMQRMIRLAEEEASEIRAHAEVDADRLRGQLEMALAEAAGSKAAFDAERERTRKQLAEQVHGLIAEATSESEQTTARAREEAGRLLQEARAEAEGTVTQAREHAGQTVQDAHRSAQQELAEARAEGERVTAASQEAAAKLVTETAAERERLDAESLSRRNQAEEDFELAITARRSEANRVITERDEGSVAAAERLVADARAHSEHLVATATAEAERLMEQATTYSNALVNRTAAESQQRVAAADAAVQKLLVLRGRLLDQMQSLVGHLDHIRELAGSAAAPLIPPDTEEGGSVAAAPPTAEPTAGPAPTDRLAPEHAEDQSRDADAAPADSLGDATVVLDGATEIDLPPAQEADLVTQRNGAGASTEGVRQPRGRVPFGKRR